PREPPRPCRRRPGLRRPLLVPLRRPGPRRPPAQRVLPGRPRQGGADRPGEPVPIPAHRARARARQVARVAPPGGVTPMSQRARYDDPRLAREPMTLVEDGPRSVL